LTADLEWLDARANALVDIVFVLDESGSIDNKEFDDAKGFIRGLLEYFSLSPNHGQVCLHTMWKIGLPTSKS